MRHAKIAAAALLALGLAACGSSPSNDGYYGSNYSGNSGYYSEYGRVVGIETVRDRSSSGTSGAGAVIGGVVGGVLGHQVGGGRGKDAATVAGAIGGAVAGNEIERRRAYGGDVDYKINVRLDNGSIRAVVQEDLGNVRVGDRVRIENGRVYRY